MSEKLPGSAGPALAAHSKDASAAGTGSASSTTGNGADHAAAKAEGVADTVGQWSSQARDAAGRAADAASQYASQAQQQFSKQSGELIDQAAEFVREQPLTALLATGAVCFVLGLLLGRA
jgi:ElaB/YqjD/DUF883 family membrane-anchored ribosome-binding protein